MRERGASRTGDGKKLGAIRVSWVNIGGAPFMEVQGRGSDSESEAERKEGRGEKRYKGRVINTPKCLQINHSSFLNKPKELNGPSNYQNFFLPVNLPHDYFKSHCCSGD